MPLPRNVRQSLPPQMPGERPGPTGGKRDRNRRARTEGLLAAAERLFLERGIGDVSIDDITHGAGVAKGSFYRYFPSKEALVRALLAPTRARVVGAFEKAEQQLRAADRDGDIGRAYLRLGRELMVVLMGSPTITRLYLQESRAPAVHARVPVRELEREVAALALRVTEAAFSHGVNRQTHPQVSTLAVIGAAERLLTAHLDGALEVQPARAVQELIRLVLEGLR